MANVSVESGHTLNVNLHWLSNSLENDSYDPKEESPYINQMTNFDLYVYNSAGAIVSITNSNNNSELARIPITESGDYHICLYQYGSIVNPTEHIALAWSIT